jgi:RNA polymerase sigma-70 factor, ECF subfamily
MAPRFRDDLASRREFEDSVAPLLPQLLGFLSRRAKGGEAEDLLQESVLRAWRQWGQLADRRSLRPWLFQICLSTLREQARKNARRERLVPVVDLEPQFVDLVASPSPTSLELLIERASDDEVWAALEGLPREFGLALELFEIEELSYREVAAALDLPMGTVMSRIHRARRQLAVVLAGRRQGASPRPGRVNHVGH